MLTCNKEIDYILIKPKGDSIFDVIIIIIYWTQFIIFFVHILFYCIREYVANRVSYCALFTDHYLHVHKC